jgi:hypothetical protein
MKVDNELMRFCIVFTAGCAAVTLVLVIGIYAAVR